MRLVRALGFRFVEREKRMNDIIIKLNREKAREIIPHTPTIILSP